MTLFPTPEAHALAAALHAELRERWAALPGLPEAAPPPPYRAAPVPGDLPARRAELIVEASDLGALRAALGAALDSGADALVVDFDDTFAPSAANVRAACGALGWVAAFPGALLVRPRALYAVEENAEFDGLPGIAALCDLGAVLTCRPQRPPHLYIPKLETVAQAEFWGEALTLAEAHLGLPRGAVRVCLQIETYAGLVNADALLYALRERAYGLNAGRWDYVFSVVKHLGAARTTPLPPRSGLTMDVDAMRAYAEALVAVCRVRGAEAIGGTAALAPHPQHPAPALDAVRADKAREAAQGFTSAWAGLPELLDAVREGLDAPSAVPAPLPAPLTRLLDLPAPAALPLAEVRDALGLALDVFGAWLAGRGVVERGGRIEDTATAELARALLWQWVRVRAVVDDGGVLDAERYLRERRDLLPDAAGAARLLDHLVLSPDCPAYFPREAQLLGLNAGSEAGA